MAIFNLLGGSSKLMQCTGDWILWNNEEPDLIRSLLRVTISLQKTHLCQRFKILHMLRLGILHVLQHWYLFEFLWITLRVSIILYRVSCVLLNIGLYFLVFLYLGSICSMHVLCVSNPALAAKSNKPLLL